MARFLLDTTFLIHIWESVPTAVDWLDETSPGDHTIGTSSVNVAEIYSGSNPQNRGAWDSFFRDTLVWDVTPATAKWAGRTRFDLARQGVQVALPDALIAGVAFTLDATIVTANVKDFTAMGLQVIQIDRPEGPSPRSHV